MSIGRIADRLTSLLDGQRTALRQGDIVALGASAPQVQAALAQLLAVRPAGEDASALAGLKARAAEQATLLSAALAGVAAAKAQMAHPKLSGFSAYDAHGRAAQIGTAPPRMERRS